jgi:hypothetical protein
MARGWNTLENGDLIVPRVQARLAFFSRGIGHLESPQQAR